MTEEQIRAELAAIEKQQQQLTDELNTSVVAEENQREKEEVESSNAEAMARGAMRGFSFGLDDEIAAGIQAV